ncbi:MAG: class I SAM-dependent methyltransferase [Proteobacteria bacterium]|nr:class I SAM-dependent methyltransferase [Pseudomonadota bacterium]MBU1736846.1 class I SAM-dependent methyltransferase [Pseudomonadota bacterium]
MKAFINKITNLLKNSRTLKRVMLTFRFQLLRKLDDQTITIFTETYFHNRDSLKELIELIPERKKMVEVGSLAGFSTRLFSLYFDEVVSVDPYQPDYDAEDLNSNRFRLSIARDLFTIRFYDDPRVRQIRESSKNAVGGFADGELDFVYIDAGHTYADVKEDIARWRSKVRKGGWMAGDDHDWPGVSKAVSEEFEDYKVVNDRWIAGIA